MEYDNRRPVRRQTGTQNPNGRKRRPAQGSPSASRRPRQQAPLSEEEQIERMIEERYREIEYLERRSRQVQRAAARDEAPVHRQRVQKRRIPREEVYYKEPEYEEEEFDVEEEHDTEKPFFSEKVIKYIGGIIGFIIVLLLVIVLFGGKLFSSFSGKEKGLASDKGVTNILLVGQDGREEVSGSRSDSMMLISVNEGSGEVKIVSLMRDMYVSIPGYEDNRINASYSYGGIDLLEETIEQNFKIKIDGNVQVDFESFQTIIDKVGGIEIELSQAEAEYLNTAYWQNNWTLSAGVQTLTGEQALAYSRVRQVGNSDFERTERQRKVLMTLFRKVKAQGMVKMLALGAEIYPMLDTDIGMSDMMGLGKAALKLKEENMSTYRLPMDGGYTNQTIREMAVLVPDLEMNQAYLKELLFGPTE